MTIPRGPSAPPLPARPKVTDARVTDSAQVSTAFYQVFPSKPASEGATPGRFPLVIWNLSATTRAVKVDGQRYPVERGQKVSVNVSREFVWQVEGREAELGRVPANEKGMTILIQR
jgi:hypothetical protein